MKTKPKLQIDWLPVLGALGLIFVALYFIVVNFSDASGEPKLEKSPYALFYKLYPKLGYHFKNQYSPHLPRPRHDLLIYFDYRGNTQELATIRAQWVQSGGTLLIAGINTGVDPISLERLPVDQLQSGEIVAKSRAGAKLKAGRLNLKGQALKHLPAATKLSRSKIMLTTRQGPLLYRTDRGAGTVMVLTDSNLLRNNLLRGADVAVFVNELLKPYYDQAIYLWEPDVVRRRHVTPILAFLFQNKLRYLSLQILWIGLLFLAWQGKRLGTPQLAAAYARRSLSEHLQAVGYWYQKTNALAIVDAINCEYFQYMLRKLTGLTLKTPQRAAQLAQIGALLATGASQLDQEQLSACLTKEDALTLSRLQCKVKLQEQIIQALQQERTGGSPAERGRRNAKRQDLV